MGVLAIIIHSIVLSVHAMTGGSFLVNDHGGTVLGAATQRHFPQAEVVTPFTATAFPIHAPKAPSIPQRKEAAARFFLKDAHAAAVIDVRSGALLYDQNAHQHRAIASLTKLYTAYVVRTSGVAMDAPVTVGKEIRSVIGSRVGCKTSTICNGTRLQVGEVLTVRDLLRAMLIVSANDAAVVLARYVAGSEDAFVALMNARAQELGLRDSHFCSPNGLEKDGQECYSSAADIGRIGALAVHDGFIWKQLNTKTAAVGSVDGTVTHDLEATNHFAQTNDIDGILGAKTGFTPRAGKSLLAVVQKPSMPDTKIVGVLLGDPYRWRDMETLIAWTWDRYTW